MNKYQEQILFSTNEITLISMYGSIEGILGSNLTGKSENNTRTDSPTVINQGEHALSASNSGTGIVQKTFFANKSFYPQVISKGHDRVTVSGTSCRQIVTFSLYPLDLKFEIDSNKVFEPKFYYPTRNKDPPFVYLSL